ncbi:hypothetical protein G7Y79_00026g058260 [Physcia stellaris]|nr:hypothetical protein G7Y79_00026g058260 [Physcia stellaris]
MLPLPPIPPRPTSPTFPTLLHTLLTPACPVLPPPRILSPSLTGPIAALQLHPTLEAALHILNGDLPAAHFLVRHMQAEPAVEGMFLHGILHRVEGDYENARAWYGNVSSSEVFASAWPGDSGLDDARDFIAKIETLRKGDRSQRDLIDEEALEKLSRREIEAVVRFCEGKFGVGRVGDAREVWVQPSPEHREMGSKMVIGGRGGGLFRGGEGEGRGRGGGGGGRGRIRGWWLLCFWLVADTVGSLIVSLLPRRFFSYIYFTDRGTRRLIISSDRRLFHKVISGHGDMIA